MIFGKSYLYGKKAGKIYLVHKVYKVYKVYKVRRPPRGAFCGNSNCRLALSEGHLLLYKPYKPYELYKLNEKSAFRFAITSFTLLILFAK